jgi:hypothetical protein
MSGILNLKERILDTIITQEGRRQLSFGKLQAEYYSFSDGGAFYKLTDQYDSGSISNNNTFRFGLEASNLPHDQITFEVDDSGKLKVKEFIKIGSSSLKVLNGQIISSSLTSNSQYVSGGSDLFFQLATDLLSGSLQNFKKQYILSSPDLLNPNFDEFILSQTKLNFHITDERPIPSQTNGGTQQANINNIESLFADKRLSHLPNYQYLPPKNKKRPGEFIGKPLGIFPRLGQPAYSSYQDIQEEIKKLESIGYVETIEFKETSRENRLACQFFEISTGAVAKLDVIDFGIFTVPAEEVARKVSDYDIQKAELEGRQFATKHVYFIGKLFVDDNQSHTFVNLFTLVFHE